MRRIGSVAVVVAIVATLGVTAAPSARAADAQPPPPPPDAPMGLYPFTFCQMSGNGIPRIHFGWYVKGPHIGEYQNRRDSHDRIIQGPYFGMAWNESRFGHGAPGPYAPLTIDINGTRYEASGTLPRTAGSAFMSAGSFGSSEPQPPIALPGGNAGKWFDGGWGVAVPNAFDNAWPEGSSGHVHAEILLGWLIPNPAYNENDPTSPDYFQWVEQLLTSDFDLSCDLSTPTGEVFADFTPAQFGKDEFQFSPTVEGGQAPYTYHWDYGDGQVSDGVVGGVLYTKPGHFPVTLTVTDAQGRKGQIVKPVDVTAPTLRVFTRLAAGQPEPVKPDDTVDVELVVESSDDGVGDLTDLRFAGDPLQHDSSRLELISGPDPEITQPFALTPGDQLVFRYRFHAREVGHAALSSQVDGVNAAGEPVTDTSDGAVDITEHVLAVTLTADPAELVQPEEEGKPPTPVDITVKIKIENTGTDDLTAVNLRSFGGQRTQAGQLFVVEQTDGPTPDEIEGLPLADLPAGESIELVAHFHTDDDADIDFSALATASFKGTRVDALGTVKVAIKAKFLLGFTSTVTSPPAGDALPAGLQIRLQGTITNLSNSVHLRIGPLYPDLEGNAGVSTVRVEGEAPDPRELPAPEFVDLEPGESKPFTVRVMTGYSDPRRHGQSPQGGTRAKVQFRPWGIATLPDGTEIPVDGSNVKAADADLVHFVSIDDSIELPDFGYLPFAATVTVGALEGVWSAIAALPDMLAGLITAPYSILSATAELQAEVWSSFTEDERQAFSRDAGLLSAAILMRNAEFGKMKFDEVWAAANQRAYEVMTAAQNEWEVGDWASTSQLYSSFLSEQVANVVMPVALGKLAKSEAAVAAINRLNAAIQEAAAPTLAAMRTAETVQEVVPLLHRIESGAILSLGHLAKAFGLSADQVAALRAAAEEFKVVLTMRSREAASLEWVERFGAVLKPEAFKVKVVNAVDRLLGYAGSDIGRMIFKKPLALAEAERTGRPISLIFDEMLASQGVVPGDARYYQAFQRLSLRTEEWLKYEDEYKRLSSARRVDVGFNYQDNGIPVDLRANAPRYRGFRLREVSGASSEEYVMEMTNGRGEFVSITGDTDGFSFTHLDGSPLTPEEHLKLLDRLKDDFNIDLQHPESGTYLNGGLEFLANNAKGEAMVQFAPGQPPRAVRFDPAHSDWANPRDYHLKFEGGIVHAGASPAPPSPPQLPNPDAIIEVPPVPEGPPPAALLVGRDGEGPMAFGRCQLRYSTDAGARALRVEPDGTVSELTVGSWQPTDLGDICFDGGDPIDIAVLPVTTLTEPSEAGATELEVDTNPGYAPAMGGGSGFRAGQTITIDPGTASQESAVLSGFGSLIVRSPLQLAHAADAVVVGSQVSAPTQPPSPPAVGAIVGAAPVAAPKVFTRVAGADRIDTALAASRESYPAPQSARSVVLARSDDFADALAGTPLAVATGGPLLLTTSRTLDPRTLAEIRRVLPPGGTVHVLGGTRAISSDVERALDAAGFDAVRLAGADRFETAVAIAHDGLGDPATLLIADGRGFPDALSAGAAAAAAGGAVVLSNGASPAPATSTYLSRRGGSVTLASIGGPAGAAYPTHERIVGSDRYETSRMVASRFFPAPSVVGLASGVDFADALAGGAAVARLQGPVLLTTPRDLPPVVRRYLTDNAASILRGVLYGGDAAVSEAPRLAAQDAIRGPR